MTTSHGGIRTTRSEALAALGAAAVLLALYAATLAPGVTLWDAGELIAAVHGVGVPHPPGTPLFVLVGRAWSSLLFWLPTALATNLLSAAATAGACGLVALLLGRRMGAATGLAAGIGAGVVATVWRSANETEVYALALLLAAATLLAADRAGRDGSGRSLALVAYLFALAVPLHLFALVAAPAAVVLAATDDDGGVRWRHGALLCGALLLAAGVGTVRWPLVAAGLALVLLVAVVGVLAGSRSGPCRPAALAVPLLALLAASALAVLLVRARHDPALNQGNPATWSALLDVVARRQYAVAPLWPRQAPVWLQVANLLEYADWQFALGLAPTPPPSWGRTGATLVFALLGLRGAAAHRRADRRSWRALLVLLVGGGLGVVAWLNLRAGPSIGAGILPADTAHEARERDYFFTLAFWTWGAWVGVGLVALSRRLLGAGWPGALAALLPAALNWAAVDRASGADATLARDAALAYLLPAPRDAVLLAAGDNETYPLWYLQQVEGVRRDVTVIVTPMLPAGWYRAELARRDGLLADTAGGRWRGGEAAIREIAARARAAGRPVLASALQTRAAVDAAGVGERPLGAWRATPSAVPVVDPAADVMVTAALRRQLRDDGSPRPSTDPAARALRRALACAALARETPPSPAGAAPALLASVCNPR